MSRKWLWLIVPAVVLMALTPAAAETIYADRYVPPRLVDGVWVTSGVSDEVTKEYAASLEQKKAQREQAAAQEAYWRAYHSGPWGYPTRPSTIDPSSSPFDQYWQQQWDEGLRIEQNPPYYTPGIYDNASGLHYRNDLGQKIGIDSFGQFYQSPIPGSRMDRVIQGAIEGTLPKVPGKSVWTLKNGQWIRLK